MKLRRLCKSGDSLKEGECPAMYVAEDPAIMVCQGTALDAETTLELRDVAANETGLTIPTETVLRAAAMLLAEHGHTAMVDVVTTFLAEREQGAPR